MSNRIFSPRNFSDKHPQMPKNPPEAANDARSPEYSTGDVREYKSVDRWLNNLKPSTSEPYLHFLRRFCKYAKTNPDALVENAKSDSGR